MFSLKLNFGTALLTLIFSSVVLGGTFLVPLSVSAQGLVPCGTQVSTDGSTITNACKFTDLLTLVTNITNFLIIIGTSVATLAFGYAGFLMMTAHGEMGKIEEAKAIFGKVIVGFLFMLSAWLIVHAIEATLLYTSGSGTGTFSSFLGS